MDNKDIYDDISSIKTIMERSAKFISLSGLSGVLAGIYALIGVGLFYILIPDYLKQYSFPYQYHPVEDLNFSGSYVIFTVECVLIAVAVLVFSIATGIFLTISKAKRQSQTIWNESSRSLLKKGLLPLITGGCFVIIALVLNRISLIAPGCLIFYGLALASASQYTYGDVKWLGVLEILLGMLALINPYYGLLFWAIGFGVLHILYGTVMYYKYDRGNRAA
jgi:hypothetical protein